MFPKTVILKIIFLFLLFPAGRALACNICGGGTGDVMVLAIDGRALINLGFSYDNFNGVWDQFEKWRVSAYTKSQQKVSLGAAYRINKHIQFGLSVPFIINNSNVPGLKTSGSSLGDISVSGRYEFFHEFQLRKTSKGSRIDKVLPYLAVTFGITLPTGTSEEDAENEVDVTGKGFFTTSLGISLTKTFIRNRLQFYTDFSWQHSFEKEYQKYFGEKLQNSFVKRPGDKFNYSLSLNYIFGSAHAVSVSASGFHQASYYIDEIPGVNSNERSLSFSAAYTYYPTLRIRITPSVKWTIPENGLGKNAVGSTYFSINVAYYFPDYSIK